MNLFAMRRAVRRGISFAAVLLAFARGSQFAVEEFGGGAVGADPIVPAGQLVNFVGDLGRTGTPTF